ncbi:MAG: hypothetical protein DRR00_29995 [Candidatus Parabeggiatoa sp. nov. 3]|nr:MAG: hypothetical protein DRR00_29995 [Gammaproteobacteria bacterium]RKZ56498.1 MAG: hypothetical protein DRQ99_28400 [Gammaproteobacteria bacterium]
MLLYFKTANSRSYQEEVEFSMIAADYGQKQLDRTIVLERYGVSVLKSSVIYGANAAGKSNLLKSIIDGVQLILKSSKNNKGEPLPHFYNKNQRVNQSKPTLYVFGLFMNNTHFEYSFSHTASRIFEEKLMAFLPERQITHFQRIYNPKTDKYDWSDLSHEFQNEASKMLKEVIVKKNNLFLSAAANLPEDSHLKLPIAEQIYDWFKNNIISVVNLSAPNWIDYEPALALIRQDKKAEAFFLEILAKTDFLIQGFDLKTLPNEEGQPKLLAKTYHEGLDINGEKIKVAYDFLTEESTGTQQLIAWLAPWLLTLSGNKVLIVDELGNSMHPLLSEYLIDLFHKKSENAQLIFTIFDLKLMDRNKMRDDQMWIVHRDNQGNSTIEPLSNYVIDDDKQLDNAYLQGVFGGIPHIDKENK